MKYAVEMGSGVMLLSRGIGFIDHFTTQLVITLNYSAIAILVTAANSVFLCFRSQFILNGGSYPTALSCFSCTDRL
jgi:hypothetical protein